MTTVTHTLPSSYDSAGALTQSGHTLIAGGGHSVGQTTGAPMYTISAWTSYSNPMFWYDVSDQKWYDNNAPDAEPVYICGTNTFSVPSTGWGEVTIANPQYVYIGNNLNGSGFQMGFNNPYYTAPPPPPPGGGGGGGGGGGFLSNNPLIENVYFAKNSDSSIALGFDWENISSYKVWVDRAGTITTHELFLTGSSGSITGYTGSGANALNNLGEGDKVWLTRGNNDDTIVDGYGSIGNPYSHQIVVWSKDSEKVYAKCFGDVTFSGGQSSAGTKATRLRGGKSYGSYESPTTNEITHELPRGLGKYQIELWTTTSGNPTSYVDYGSFFRDSSQVTCNFW